MSKITQISKYPKCPDCSKCSNTGHCALANFHLFKSVRYLYYLKCQLFQMIQNYNSKMIHWTRCFLRLWWLYFQIQGGIFCICTCVCISMILFTFYLEVSSQMRAPCMMGTRMKCNVFEKKTFTQNNNNHTKEITFSMCPPLRFWRQLWEFRRYFSFVSLLTHSEDTTVKTIYCLWANGARLTLRWNGTSLLRKCEKIVT